MGVKSKKRHENKSNGNLTGSPHAEKINKAFIEQSIKTLYSVGNYMSYTSRCFTIMRKNYVLFYITNKTSFEEMHINLDDTSCSKPNTAANQLCPAAQWIAWDWEDDKEAEAGRGWATVGGPTYMSVRFVFKETEAGMLRDNTTSNWGLEQVWSQEY